MHGFQLSEFFIYHKATKAQYCNLTASIASLMTSSLCMLIKSCDTHNTYVIMAMI